MFRAWDKLDKEFHYSENYHGLDNFFASTDGEEHDPLVTVNKYGKRFYEGDIVQGEYKRPFVSLVMWDAEEARFWFEAPNYFWETDGAYVPWEEVAVIGNIHQNPELLQEKP